MKITYKERKGGAQAQGFQAVVKPRGSQTQDRPSPVHGVSGFCLFKDRALGMVPGLCQQVLPHSVMISMCHANLLQCHNLKKITAKMKSFCYQQLLLVHLPPSLCVFTASSPTRVQCVHSSCQPPGYPVTHSCRQLQVTIVVSFEALGRYQVGCTAVIWKLRQGVGRQAKQP